MSTITAAMVKQLREKSGAGMMDCKNALTECGGDMEKAVEFLRKKGLHQAHLDQWHSQMLDGLQIGFSKKKKKSQLNQMASKSKVRKILDNIRSSGTTTNILKKQERQDRRLRRYHGRWKSE